MQNKKFLMIFLICMAAVLLWACTLKEKEIAIKDTMRLIEDEIKEIEGDN